MRARGADHTPISHVGDWHTLRRVILGYDISLQVIQAGTWGGIYFNPRGGRPGIYGSTVDVTHEEFPVDWFEGLPPEAFRGRRYDTRRNKYRVRHWTWRGVTCTFSAKSFRSKI